MYNVYEIGTRPRNLSARSTKLCRELDEGLELWDLEQSVERAGWVLALVPNDAILRHHLADNCLSPRITLLDSGNKSLEVHQYWKAMSLEHPGFMHGALCIAAIKLALVQPNQAPELVERFMYPVIQAMAAIRRNLADPELALSDESLASVFNMVCSEEILALKASGFAWARRHTTRGSCNWLETHARTSRWS